MGENFDIFRKRLKELLKQRGIIQKDFAKKIGIDRSYLNMLLSGNKRFNEDTIESVCKALGISINDMFSDGQQSLSSLPPRLQRIVRYWQVEPYRNFVSWQEDEVYNGCIERGYISPDGKILKTGDGEEANGDEKG